MYDCERYPRSGLFIEISGKGDCVDFFAQTDENLHDYIEKEREIITRILIVSGVLKSYFGHVHKKWTGVALGVNLRSLDICEMVEL